MGGLLKDLEVAEDPKEGLLYPLGKGKLNGCYPIIVVLGFFLGEGSKHLGFWSLASKELGFFRTEGLGFLWNRGASQEKRFQ